MLNAWEQISLITGRRPVQTQKIARRVQGKGQKAIIVRGDLSQASFAKSAFDEAFGTFGRVGSRGITVNTIAPGPADTPFYHGQETQLSGEGGTQSAGRAAR